MKYLAIILLLVSCSTSSATKVDIINYGELKASPSIGRFVQKQSHSGYINLMHENESPIFLQKEEIDAKIGKRFGINVMISGGKFGEIANLITKVTHPSFSDGQTIDQWDSPMNYGISRYTGWLFESKKELVPGEWTFEILDRKGNVLAKKIFQVRIAE
jgi:hypothetical protein